MMDNRGQAFSVFQLLIAAIVAVAILGVLFMILGNIVTPTGDPVTEISQALQTAKTGGQSESRAFSMSAGNSVRGTDFERYAIEGDMVLFYVNTDQLNLDDASGFEVASRDAGDEVYNVLTYHGANPRNLQATVLCMTTGTRLQAELDAIEDSMAISADGGDDVCLEDDSISPCCAVIIKRATN